MNQQRLPVLGKSGRMAEAIDRLDWSRTALGPIEKWSHALQLNVNTMLGSRFPMFLVWGPERIFIHNDAYIAILGQKYPQALGQPVDILWSEVIDQIGPIINEAFNNRPSHFENLPIVLRRHGYDEQTYFTFSYSPVIDDDRSVGGSLCVCVETTPTVLAKQRQADENERLRMLLNQSPGFAAALIGPDLVFEMHNEAYTRLVGVRELIGRTFAEAIPEASEQGFVPMLREVMATKRPFLGSEIRYEAHRTDSSEPEEVFVDCVFQPMIDARGEAFGVFVQGHDVTEQVLSRRSLLEADRQKDRFIATLAHELRNPLAPISSAAHLLGQRAVAPQVAERAVKVIGRQVGQMGRLLDDLLDAARISQNQLRLRIQLCDVAELIRMGVETAQPALDAKGHRLVMQSGSEPIEVVADPARVAQVIANLLTNAAKYTDPNGAIEIRSATRDGSWEFSVKDNGIGIEPSSIDRVFAMFSQERDALERSEGGLGIGLGLAKALIEAHGGTISARSDGRGHGSSFSFGLPLPESRSESSIYVTHAGGIPEAKHSVAGMSVLLIDDNADLVEVTRMSLEQDDCSVHTAFDGVAGLEAFRRLRPEVAIIDIGMPLMNGYELATAIRKERDGQDAFLIAATGWGADTDAAKALAAGFDAHLTKPFEMEHLLSLIASRDIKPKN